MKKFLQKQDRHLLGLSLILLFATFLRFWGLDSQSAWVDELHTMNEADPEIPWSQLFDYLKCCDQHPPLYYVCNRFLFTVFGHTVFVARALSAVCGIMSVWGMYLLGVEFFGKENNGKDVGLIAALLTTVNYYSIFYSHEARCYSMAFLFTVFSFIYFIRLSRRLMLKDAILYGIFTVLLLYSHYYSLFIVASQVLIAVCLLLFEWDNRKTFIRMFLIAGAVILVGYLPWLPFLLTMSKIQSFWIAPIYPDFAVNFFYGYFGNFPLMNPFITLLLLYYCFHVFSQPKTVLADVKSSPFQFSFVILFVTVAVTFMLPYIRSLLVVPMLFNRYTIVVVPLFIMAIAAGAAMINSSIVRFLILSSIAFLSFFQLLIIERYYYKPLPRKSQFRELTEFISESKEDMYPIVEEKTAWHHGYYLKRAGYTAPVLGGKKEATVDSILLRTSSKYDLNAFWLVGAHGFEPALNEKTKKNLDTAFTLVKSREFYDAWAELYVRQKGTQLIPTYFSMPTTDFGSQQAVPLLSGTISSTPIPIAPGKYIITFVLGGTKAYKIYPQMSVYLNKKKIGELIATSTLSSHKISFEITEKEDAVFSITLDNDMANPSKGEDRNAYFKNIILSKI